jgi:hypothetical protein
MQGIFYYPKTAFMALKVSSSGVNQLIGGYQIDQLLKKIRGKSN